MGVPKETADKVIYRVPKSMRTIAIDAITENGSDLIKMLRIGELEVGTLRILQNVLHDLALTSKSFSSEEEFEGTEYDY